ncbi:MAG: hypothetical protein WCO71_05235 [Pseudomonadota bacterium]
MLKHIIKHSFGSFRSVVVIGITFALSSGAFASSKTKLENKYLGRVIHPKVNIHVESRGGNYHFYSTNHIGLPIVIPVGADLSVTEITSDSMLLAYDKEHVKVKMDYVEKHNRMPMAQWLERDFSLEPVSLPDGLTDKEKKAIKAGEAEIGMSRKAVFLAIGYPPASLSASPDATRLLYEKKRFNRVEYMFDEKDKLVHIKN